MRRGTMGVVGAGVLWVAACGSQGSPPSTGATSSSTSGGTGGTCNTVEACGATCAPCPSVTNGDATCDGQQCGISCHPGTLNCGFACSICPANAATTVCQGDGCEAVTCVAGYHVCGGMCASDDDPATCGTSCTPCPASAGATATCTAGVCGLGCGAGTNLCGGTCVPESPSACGASCQMCTAPAGSIATCDAGMCGVACGPGTSPSASGCTAWTSEVIGAGVRWEVTLRVSATGVPHVAILSSDPSETAIVHGQRGSTGWAFESIDGVNPDPTQNPYYELGGTGLALDATGAPWVGYRKTATEAIGGGQSSQLFVAQQQGGVWGTPKIVESYQVNDTGSIQEPVNLAFDGMGQLHATYSKCCFNNYYPWMRYGVLAAGSWTLEDGPTNVASDSTSLALAAEGTPRVASVQGGEELDFLDRGSGAWTSTILSNMVGQGAGLEVRLSEIALDPSGVSHLCYQSADGHLTYATEGTNAWTTETVDSSPSVGTFCSLAIDSKGNPLICYRDATNGTMKCATKAAGSWTTNVVASGGDAGEGIDVVFDTQDLAHVVYFDGTTGNWMYLH